MAEPTQSTVRTTVVFDMHAFLEVPNSSIIQGRCGRRFELRRMTNPKKRPPRPRGKPDGGEHGGEQTRDQRSCMPS